MVKRTIRMRKMYRVMSIDEVKRIEPDGETRAEGDPATYDIAISSEYPVERWFGTEILSHDRSAVDLSRLRSRAAVFVDHMGDQVGVVESARVDDDKVLRGTVRFSRNPRGQEVERDIVDKVRSHISVGYIPQRAKMVEEGTEDKPATFRVTRWLPMEVSVVGVPADPTVGVGRGAAPKEGDDYFEVEIEGDEVQPKEEERHMPKPNVPDPASTTHEVEVSPAKEHAEIVRLASANGMIEKVPEWIEQGMTADKVARAILMARATKGVAAMTETDPIEAVPDKDRSAYSYHKAILLAMGRREGGGKWEGLEAEVSDELHRNRPEGMKIRGGVLVPLTLRRDATGMAVRTLDATNATQGKNTVFTEPRELIDILRTRTAVVQMGAQMLTGLNGPIAFPRQTAAHTVGWFVEEGADPGETDIAFDQVTMGPKSMIGATSYTRQLLAQSSIDVESVVRNDLAAGHARAIDFAALHGPGTGGSPTGIYAASGVLTEAFSNPATWDDVVNMQGKVADANVPLTALGYMTTPLGAASLKKILAASAAGSDRLWTGPLTDGLIAGYKAVATNQVAKNLGAGTNEHGIVFANWAMLMIALWGAMELIVDPYAKKRQAWIEVASFQMADVALRHPESFCKGTGWLAA